MDIMSLNVEAMTGRTLCGTYRLQSALGSGGMGAVFRAQHLRTGAELAVKMLHPETAASPTAYQRFENEARAVAALHHSQIVRVLDLDRDSETGIPFIVMDLVQGEDLERRLERVGRLSVVDVLRIAADVGSALQATHDRGIIHRDIKPANIMLVPEVRVDGMVERAMLLDFGVAKIKKPLSVEVHQVTQTNSVLGTPYYMSPEAAAGQNERVDHRTDQWALAVVVYQALSGRLPFEGENVLAILTQIRETEPIPLGDLVPGLSPELVGAVMRALRKPVHLRFDSIQAFVRQLHGELQPLPEGPAELAQTRVLDPLPPANAKVVASPLAVTLSDPNQPRDRTGHPLDPNGGSGRMLRRALPGLLGLAAIAGALLWWQTLPRAPGRSASPTSQAIQSPSSNRTDLASPLPAATPNTNPAIEARVDAGADLAPRVAGDAVRDLGVVGPAPVHSGKPGGKVRKPPRPRREREPVDNEELSLDPG